MKFIDSVNISISISKQAEILLKKGILVSTTDDYANIQTNAARNIKRGIWIHIDEQYDDALKLLKNRNHSVSNPLTYEEMESIKLASKSQMENYIKKLSEKTLTLIFSAILITLIAYVAFHLT